MNKILILLFIVVVVTFIKVAISDDLNAVMRETVHQCSVDMAGNPDLVCD